MKTVIALDLGTSGCKVIALSQDGKILAEDNQSYPIFYPQKGWSEQNPADWWDSACIALKNVTSQVSSTEIVAVGFSGQMHGLVALDQNNNVIRNAILWNDQRTEKQCTEITSLAGGLDSLLAMTDNPMITGFTAPKILWMKENEPENFSKIHKILNPKDYIRFKLTGEYFTDVSEASGTGLFDVKNRCFNQKLLNILGFKSEWFPAVFESVEKAGTVTAAASELTGIPAGCVCSGGGGDAVISTTGLGLVKSGRVGITVGTSGVVAMGLDSFTENPGGRMQVSCGNIPQKWHIMGATLSAAGAYAWFSKNFADYEKSLEQNGGKHHLQNLDEQAEAVSPASDGLFFLPYLIGERCPVYDANATGGFFGVTMMHQKGHFARAVMEGVAFSLKQVFDEIVKLSGVTPDEIVLAGGGASSEIWRKIFADIFNLPVRTVYGSKQGGAFGAALVAGVTGGIFESMNDTVSVVKTQNEVLPDEKNVEIYAKAYKKYCRLYDSTKWMWE